MAIAPSKLGRLVATVADDGTTFVRSLRERGLVADGVDDADLLTALQRAEEEHEQMPEGQRAFNTPSERVRVFLGPFLSTKGRSWAVPLKSLDLPDDEAPREATAPRRTKASMVLAVLGVVVGLAVVAGGAPLGGSYLIASGAGLAVIAACHLVAPAFRPWGLLALVWGSVAFANAIHCGAAVTFRLAPVEGPLAQIEPVGRTVALLASAGVSFAGLWALLRQRAASRRSPAP